MMTEGKEDPSCFLGREGKKKLFRMGKQKGDEWSVTSAA